MEGLLGNLLMLILLFLLFFILAGGLAGLGVLFAFFDGGAFVELFFASANGYL